MTLFHPSQGYNELSNPHSTSELAQNRKTEITRNLQSDKKINFQLHTLLHFTEPVDNSSSSENVTRQGIVQQYQRAAAIALAVDHMNTGNTSLIKEIENISSCRFNFTLRFDDTQGQSGIALDLIYNALVESGFQNKSRGFIGATHSGVSEATSILTGFRGLVQISGDSTSASLDDKSQFPQFARTIPSDEYNVMSFLTYIRNVLDVKYLAILHSNSEYGNNYAQAMREANRVLGLDINFYTRSVDLHLASPEVALLLDTAQTPLEEIVKDLKDQAYTYIYCILTTGDDTGGFDELLREAYNQGIAGPDSQRTWLFSDTFDDNQLLNRNFSSDDILVKAYQGVGRLEVASNSQALKGRGVYDEFERQMSMLLPDNKEYFRSIFPPIDNFGVPFLDDPAFLQPPLSSNIAFLYEAAIALGLSACKSDVQLSNNSHFYELTHNDFSGITGQVSFDDVTGSRLSTTVLYSVTNFQPEKIMDGNNTNLIHFQPVLTHLEEKRNWSQVSPYIYADGTTNVPSDVLQPTILYLDLHWIIISLFTCGILCALSLGFATWTFVNRKSRVVRASQPFFLYILCLGIALIGISIIPFTVTSSIACNLSVWFFSIGSALTSSAIFSKTWRINKIMNSGNKLKRIKVTAFDASIPMVCLLSGNIIILAIMTAVDPVSLDLKISKEDSQGRPVEAYHRCDANGDRVWFYVVLSLINGSAIGWAVYQAWKARNLSVEYSESKYIFKALQVTVIVIFVAAPLLIWAWDQEDINIMLFAISAVIFAFGCSTLFLIFIPKIKASKQKRKNNTRISGFAGAASRHSSSSGERQSGIKILYDLSPKDMITKIETLEAQLQEAEGKLKIEAEKTAAMTNGDTKIEREALLDDNSHRNIPIESIEHIDELVQGDGDMSTLASRRSRSIISGSMNLG